MNRLTSGVLDSHLASQVRDNGSARWLTTEQAGDDVGDASLTGEAIGFLCQQMRIEPNPIFIFPSSGVSWLRGLRIAASRMVNLISVKFRTTSRLFQGACFAPQALLSVIVIRLSLSMRGLQRRLPLPSVRRVPMPDLRILPVRCSPQMPCM